jgi:hypothetical protein
VNQEEEAKPMKSRQFIVAWLAYLYPLFYQGRSPMEEGITFGILMGIFMGSNAVLAGAGKNQVSSLSTWLVLLLG